MADNFAGYDKTQQKHRLMVEFGMMLAPLKALANRQEPPTARDYQRAITSVESGLERWWAHSQAFVSGTDTFRQVGSKLTDVFFSPILLNLTQRVAKPEGIGDAQQFHLYFKRLITALEADFYKLVDMVSIDWEVTLSEAEQPFTFHMHVLDAVAGVRRRLHYIDRYLKPDFFSLYLRNLDRGLEIRLLTTHGQAGGRFGVEGVSAVSDLFRQEFTNYQLIELPPTEFHGRQLRIDDEVFLLDASASDAGKAPTAFGPVANQEAANRIVDGLISRGTVIQKS